MCWLRYFYSSVKRPCVRRDKTLSQNDDNRPPSTLYTPLSPNGQNHFDWWVENTRSHPHRRIVSLSSNRIVISLAVLHCFICMCLAENVPWQQIAKWRLFLCSLPLPYSTVLPVHSVPPSLKCAIYFSSHIPSSVHHYLVLLFLFFFPWSPVTLGPLKGTLVWIHMWLVRTW